MKWSLEFRGKITVQLEFLLRQTKDTTFRPLLKTNKSGKEEEAEKNNVEEESIKNKKQILMV